MAGQMILPRNPASDPSNRHHGSLPPSLSAEVESCVPVDHISAQQLQRLGNQLTNCAVIDPR